MCRLLLALDQLRTHNVADAVGDKHGSSHGTLLGCTSNIRHANDDSLADYGAKSANDGVARNRCGGMICPFTLPDHSAACDDRETVPRQQDEADIGYPRADMTAQENGEETQAAEGKLP